MSLPDAATVFLDARDLGPCRVVGTLRPAGRAPDSPIGFVYAAEWWSEPAAFRLDPSHYEQTVAAAVSGTGSPARARVQRRCA